MRTMKDKERFFLVVKVFLDINGPSTAREIAEYLKKCPVRMQKDFTPVKIGLLLRGQSWLKKERIGETKPWKYWVEV